MPIVAGHYVNPNSNAGVGGQTFEPPGTITHYDVRGGIGLNTDVFKPQQPDWSKAVPAEPEPVPVKSGGGGGGMSTLTNPTQPIYNPPGPTPNIPPPSTPEGRALAYALPTITALSSGGVRVGGGSFGSGVTYIGEANIPQVNMTANEYQNYVRQQLIEQGYAAEDLKRGRYSVKSQLETYKPIEDVPQKVYYGSMGEYTLNGQDYSASGQPLLGGGVTTANPKLPKLPFTTGVVSTFINKKFDDLIRFGEIKAGTDSPSWEKVLGGTGADALGVAAISVGTAAKTVYGVLGIPSAVITDIAEGQPLRTVGAIRKDIISFGRFDGGPGIYSPFVKRLIFDAQYNPAKAVGEIGGLYVGGKIIKGTNEIIIKGVAEKTPLGSWAQNIKENPTYKNIAYDLSEESGIYGLKNAVKLLGVDIINTEKGSKVLFTKEGYNLYMQEPITLPASLTAQKLAGVKAQSELEGLRRDLNIVNERVPPEFSPEKAALQQSIYEQAIKGSGGTVKGSTALITETGFKGAYLELYGEPRIPGDIELSIGRFKPSKTVSLVEGETPTTVKAKLQLGQENIYNKLFKTKEVLAKEKAALRQGLNKNFDITELPDISEQQQFALKNAPGKIKGSTADKIMDLSRGELKEDATLLGKDIDIEKPIFGTKSKIFVEKFAEKFPDITAKQMGIKSVGVTKTLLRDATDYPLGSILEVPTGRVLQIGEGVRVKTTEIFPEKLEPTIERLPELKGGNINIDLTSISSEGTKVVDIALEKSLKMRAGDFFRRGKEITYYDKEGKPLFKTVKELTREFDKADRVINARTLEQVEGGTEKFLGSLEKGKYEFNKPVKVKAKGAEAFGAEQALKLTVGKPTPGIEPNLVLTSEPPRQVLSIKGIDEKAVPVKIAEFFNEKDYPDLLKSKPTFVKGVQVQSVFSSRIGKTLAEIDRGRYADIPFELDKDLKDITTTKVADIRQFQKEIDKLDPISKQIAQGRLNKAIDLLYQYEGRAPISNTILNSQLDLTTQYLKERAFPSKAKEAKTYEPLTKEQFDKANEIKLDLTKDKYTQSQLRSAIGRQIEREAPSPEYSRIFNKAEQSLKDFSGGKNIFSREEAQGVTNKIFTDLNKDIKLSRQKYAESLKQQREKPYYKQGYLKSSYGIGYSKGYSKGYVDYGYGYTDYGYSKDYGYKGYVDYGKSYIKPYAPKVNYKTDIPGYTKSYPKETPPYNPYYEEPKKRKQPILVTPYYKKQKEKPRTSQAPTYNVLLRKRGKFQSIGTDLGRGEALQFGSNRALKDIARTFKLVPTGKTREVFTGFDEQQFMPRENLFRQYKVRQGKQLSTPDMFIQRTSANLQSSEEKQQLSDAKRLNKLMNTQF